MLFALLNVFTIVMSLLADDRLLLNWLTFPYEYYIIALYLCINGIYVTLAWFASLIMPMYASRRELRWFTLFSAVSITAGIASVYTTDLFGYPTPVVGLWSAAITIRIFLRSALKGVQDSLFLLVGAAAVAVNVVWGLVTQSNIIEIYFYPVDLIVGFLAFAAYWFKSYFRTTKQTEELALKLQQADKMKDEFLANTSHELRNPLHGILNIAQSVLDNRKQQLGSKHAADLTLLIAVAKRMSFMLDDLLDLNRLQKQGIVLHRSPVRLQAIASGLLDMIRFTNGKKQVRLASEIPEDLPAVWIDEHRIMQVLFNLLHNAVKYTHEGSVTLRAFPDGQHARIEVADTGIGMDEETIARIFRPYEQGDALAAEAGGIGLGLSISKQLIELHGSRIDVTSVPGQGSVFTFKLSLADPAAHEQSAGEGGDWLIHHAAERRRPSPSWEMTRKSLNKRPARGRKAANLAARQRKSCAFWPLTTIRST